MSTEDMDARTAIRYLSRELSIACARIQTLEARLQIIYHAAVAHAGDVDAHPCSANDALKMLRTIGE